MKKNFIFSGMFLILMCVGSNGYAGDILKLTIQNDSSRTYYKHSDFSPWHQIPPPPQILASPPNSPASFSFSVSMNGTSGGSESRVLDYTDSSNVNNAFSITVAFSSDGKLVTDPLVCITSGPNPPKCDVTRADSLSYTVKIH